MENIFEKEEFAKNVYVIKHKLGGMKKVHGRDFYEWQIGRFYVRIFTKPRSFLTEDDSILKHHAVDIDVYELHKAKDGSGKDEEHHINLRDDEPFKSFEPIMYKTFKGVNGIINMSDGRQIPILHLCELIRFLHRLSNLTVFT